MYEDKLTENILSARAVGQFPISIATSLAIESAIGILPEAPAPSPEVKSRDLIKINIRTLIRNLVGSVETEDKGKIDAYVAATYIRNEMVAIETIIAEHSDGRCQVAFYHCSYTDIINDFNRSIFKTPNTLGQKHSHEFENKVCRILTSGEIGSVDVKQYVRRFEDFSGSALLLTHYPIDLLQRYRFSSVALLESHTGAIKPPIMWNTKLANGRELEIIPFDRMTLQLFGDNVTFVPMPIKIRKRMYNIAVNNKWTAATTKDYVIHCVEMNRDPALEVLVKDLYRR